MLAAPVTEGDVHPVAVACWWYDQASDAARASALQAATEQLHVVGASSPLATLRLVTLLHVASAAVAWSSVVHGNAWSRT